MTGDLCHYREYDIPGLWSGLISRQNEHPCYRVYQQWLSGLLPDSHSAGRMVLSCTSFSQPTNPRRHFKTKTFPDFGGRVRWLSLTWPGNSALCSSELFEQRGVGYKDSPLTLTVYNLCISRTFWYTKKKGLHLLTLTLAYQFIVFKGRTGLKSIY